MNFSNRAAKSTTLQAKKSQSRHFSRPESAWICIYRTISTLKMRRRGRAAGSGEALPLLWGRKWCRKGEVGRVSLERKEEQSFSIPASRSEKRKRNRGGGWRKKRMEGAHVSRGGRRVTSSGGNGKLEKATWKWPKCCKEVSLFHTLHWNPMEGGFGSFHLTHLVCGSAGGTWTEGVCSYGGGRLENRWSPDWWISAWSAPWCHNNPIIHIHT